MGHSCLAVAARSGARRENFFVARGATYDSEQPNDAEIGGEFQDTDVLAAPVYRLPPLQGRTGLARRSADPYNKERGVAGGRVVDVDVVRWMKWRDGGCTPKLACRF
jgi:hypothetical protein